MNEVAQVSYEENLEAWDLTDEVIRKASARRSLVLGAAGALTGSFTGMAGLGWMCGSAKGKALFPGKSDE